MGSRFTIPTLAMFATLMAIPAARAATTIAATGSLVVRPARCGSTHTARTAAGRRAISSRTGPAP